jgi:hypothetical protein
MRAMAGFLSLLALLAFIWIALSNLYYLLVQLRHDGQGPSFIFVLGPLMALLFLLGNPWQLAAIWWALPLLDSGLWALVMAIIKQARD